MKKLLFALSIIAMFVLVGCNPCEVGDCACTLWTFENKTNETVIISDLKDGTFSSLTIPPKGVVDVYVENAADSLSFNYEPKTVRVSKVEGDYIYKITK